MDKIKASFKRGKAAAKVEAKPTTGGAEKSY